MAPDIDLSATSTEEGSCLLLTEAASALTKNLLKSSSKLSCAFGTNSELAAAQAKVAALSGAARGKEFQLGKKNPAALMDERSSAMFVIHLPACPLPSPSSPGSVWGLHYNYTSPVKVLVWCISGRYPRWPQISAWQCRWRGNRGTKDC